MMLQALHVPISWSALVKRTYEELMSDDCLGLAAQLAYYFFLALFPALLFMVALITFLPFGDVMDTMLSTLGRIAPPEVVTIIGNQIMSLANAKNGGLLTLGAAGALWSTSSGVTAIISALNQTYDIQESRPWWKVRLVAIGLTLSLALFTIIAFTLVVAGPALAERVAAMFGLGAAFTWTWNILQWPVVFALVALAIALVYYFGPDAEQEWSWITPGSVAATLLWLVVSLGFRVYVVNFGSYNATYGTIAGIIVLLLWFYLSGLALLAGAELNAEVEHASPYGKDPGERRPGERMRIGRLAERLWEHRQKEAPVPLAAMAHVNCDVDSELPPALPAHPRHRASDWLVGGLMLGEAALVTYLKLRTRLKRVPD
jgi:membrane protein